MGFDTIVTNGRVVTATDTYSSDVAITDGKIAAIGQNLPRENATHIIDAAGKYVLPGGIDVHTHLDMPFGGTTSADDFETGTRAAAQSRTASAISPVVVANNTASGGSLLIQVSVWPCCSRKLVPVEKRLPNFCASAANRSAFASCDGGTKSLAMTLVMALSLPWA